MTPRAAEEEEKIPRPSRPAQRRVEKENTLCTCVLGHGGGFEYIPLLLLLYLRVKETCLEMRAYRRVFDDFFFFCCCSCSIQSTLLESQWARNAGRKAFHTFLSGPRDRLVKRSLGARQVRGAAPRRTFPARTGNDV